MFRTRGTALPTPTEIQRIHLDGIIASNPITHQMVKPLRMPTGRFNALQRAWDTFKGPSNLTDFRVEVECHEGRKGFVVAYARYANAEVRCGVTLVDDDPDDPEGMDEIETDIEVGYFEAEHQTEEFWTAVWEKVEPITQLKAELRVGPNAICPRCNSGRKFKKCHGRYA